MFYFVKIRKYCVWIFSLKMLFAKAKICCSHSKSRRFRHRLQQFGALCAFRQNRRAQPIFVFVFFFFHFTHCRFKSRATDISSLLRCPKPKNILSGEYTVQSAPLFGGFLFLQYQARRRLQTVLSAPPLQIFCDS